MQVLHPAAKMVCIPLVNMFDPTYISSMVAFELSAKLSQECWTQCAPLCTM